MSVDCFDLGVRLARAFTGQRARKFYLTSSMKALFAPLLLSLALTTAVFAAWPINDVCPVDGKAARPIYRVKTAEGFVAFCCIDCQTTFEKAPGKYTVKKKDSPK